MNKLRSQEVFEKMVNFINNWIVQMRVAYGSTAMNRLRGVGSGKKQPHSQTKAGGVKKYKVLEENLVAYQSFKCVFLVTQPFYF